MDAAADARPHPDGRPRVSLLGRVRRTSKSAIVFSPAPSNRLSRPTRNSLRKDRGCTAAGCDVPGYWTDVHHTDHWSRGGLTDIEELTLACKADHRLADKAGGQSTSATTRPSGSRRPILTAASRRPTIITNQKGFSTATHGAGSCSLIRHCAFTVPKGPNTRELSACCDTHQQCLAH